MTNAPEHPNMPEAEALNICVDILIRPAVQEDLPKLELNGQFIQFRNLFRRGYREQLTGRRLLMVAESGNTIVGRLFILFESSDSQIADGSNRAYLYSFYVVQSLRGKGLGTRMVNYAERLLNERGYQFVTLAVAKDNPGALRLYERLAYSRLREDPGKWSYTDHMGRLQRVNEPCWILEKHLISSEKPKRDL